MGAPPAGGILLARPWAGGQRVSVDVSGCGGACKQRRVPHDVPGIHVWCLMNSEELSVPRVVA